MLHIHISIKISANHKVFKLDSLSNGIRERERGEKGRHGEIGRIERGRELEREKSRRGWQREES